MASVHGHRNIPICSYLWKEVLCETNLKLTVPCHRCRDLKNTLYMKIQTSFSSYKSCHGTLSKAFSLHAVVKRTQTGNVWFRIYPRKYLQFLSQLLEDHITGPITILRKKENAKSNKIMMLKVLQEKY